MVKYEKKIVKLIKWFLTDYYFVKKIINAKKKYKFQRSNTCKKRCDKICKIRRGK